MSTKEKTALQKPLDSMRDLLEKAAPKLQEVAPKHLKIERLVRLLLSACSRNPKILQCSADSVLLFAMKCSETGLEPIGAGGMWAVPFENRKAGTVELQAIPDYRGLVHIARRAGCIKDAWAEVVRENDNFTYELGTQPTLVHTPARRDRGALECAYCVIVMPDDSRRFVVMDRDDVEAIRKRSRASQSGPWVTDEAEMWKKTVVRRAMKPFSGVSRELDVAFETDDEATGLDLVGERAPVPMPRAIDEPPANGEHADKDQVPAAVGDAWEGN